jgi:uncharacterized protein YndB with AHSA1/START domain
MNDDFNPELDLVLDRVIDVPRELVWNAWTTPEHLKKWFCPLPWKTVECEMDLRPGGRFHTVMQSPEGQTFPSTGCYLEIVKNEKLVWTSALEPGYRPAPHPEQHPGHECAELLLTAILTLEPHEKGTRYHVLVRHMDKEGRERHEQMGFHEGWGTVLDQLVAELKRA